MSSKHIKLCLHLSGNAATHRGLFTMDLLLDMFKQHERAQVPNNLLDWSGTPGPCNEILFRHSQDVAPLAIRFIRFVSGFISYEARLYGHAHFYSSTKVFNGQLHLFLRSMYRHVKSYEIVVLAPKQAKPFICDNAYLPDNLVLMPHWNVNSMRNVSRVPNGIRFDANEDDARVAFNHICESIREEAPELLWNAGSSFVERALIRKCRRGNVFYVRVGIEWAELGHPVDWGDNWPPVPISSIPAVEIPPCDDICAICLDNMSGNIVRWGSCKHVFHLECVRSMWDASSEDVTCPLCRSPLSALERVVVSHTKCKKRQGPVTRSMTKNVRRKIVLE